MEDSDLQVLENSAHFYMECSNKGTCDRATGECNCFDGYDGVACQRASCPGFPNSCSGNGVCKTKRQLAWADNENIYELWDKDSTMGCECDPGYSGADCSERNCKYGVDPLYLDDSATIHYSIYDFATLTTASTIDFTDGHNQPGTGHWAIRFYDNHGEDWLTQPIRAGAACSDVIQALEAIPNDVIPVGYTYCTRTSRTNVGESGWKGWDAQNDYGSSHPYLINYNLSIWEAITPANQGEDSYYTEVMNNYNTSGSNNKLSKLSGYIYRLKFYGNPGAFQEPEIELYLDGKRPSLVSSTANKKVITKVWTDGQQGEDNDYFADHCDSVTVTIGHSGDAYYLTGLTTAEKKLLRKCLGPSDFDTSNNVEIYNWDYGNYLYPHIIKLVRTVTVYTDGGYYAAIWYDTSASALDTSGEGTGIFRLLNPFYPPDAFKTDNYEVYTTQGTLALTSNHSGVVASFASKYFYTVNSTYDSQQLEYDGDISCEIGLSNSYKTKYIHHCLNKTDLFTVLSWEYPHLNPPHINLYTAERLQQVPFEHLRQEKYFKRWDVSPDAKYKEMHYMTHVIKADLSSNWGMWETTRSLTQSQPHFRVYKFFPASASTYNYVNECSNRGICQRDSGVCACFPGYTNDDCSVQNSIAL